MKGMRCDGVLFLFAVVALSIWACAPVTSVKDECPVDVGSEAEPISGGAVFPPFSLPIPVNDGERGYLGLSGSGTFTVGQIKARLVIIEVFSFYCPHCQRMAAQINDLSRLIESRADLKGKIKMIGIGAKNSAYEVEAYRDRYHVPFPLFADREMEITEKLGVQGTPTFFGVRVGGKSSPLRTYFREGDFPDNEQFLAEIVRLSGL